MFLNVNNQIVQCFKRKTLKLILIRLLNYAYSKTQTYVQAHCICYLCFSLSECIGFVKKFSGALVFRSDMLKISDQINVSGFFFFLTCLNVLLAFKCASQAYI